MGTTAFVNGTVFDGHRYLGAGTVVVRDGRVALVEEGVQGPSRDRATEVVDLAGGLVSPGFTDAHVHPIHGGFGRLRCDLTELSTREEYLAEIRAYADRYPEREWVLGGGWAMSALPRGASRRATSIPGSSWRARTRWPPGSRRKSSASKS